MEELKIEYIKIEQLTLYKNNTKIHTEEQVEHIANSIKRFGFNDPLGISGKENIVLEGNGRIEAARKLGFKELPCVRLDHLSAEAQQAYVIAHNALNMETGFDEEKLLQELTELQNSFDFKEFGLGAEKYVSKLDNLQKQELKPYSKVHYLISLDINQNDKLIEMLEQIKMIEGVEIESSLN